MQKWSSIFQKWISLACASMVFIAALGGVLFVLFHPLFHPSGLRTWMLVTATACVLAGSYWICSDLAKGTEETRATGEG
jgi:hypothetical protein